MEPNMTPRTVNHKPIIIAMDDSLLNWVNNLNLLPIASNDHIIHNDPHAQTIGEDVVYNYDVLITTKDYNQASLLKPIIRLPRVSKSQQQHEMMVLQKKHGLKYVRGIPTYSAAKGYAFKLGLMNEHKKIVLKPEHGARGLSQIIVDTQTTSIVSVMRELEQSMLSPEAFEVFKEKFPDVKGSLNHPKRQGDHEINLIADQGICAQAYMAFKFEVRVLFVRINESELEFRFYEREIYDNDGYPQASGANLGVHSRIDLNNVNMIPDEVITDLTTICNELGLNFGSIDLGCVELNQWHLIEYSNQFGIEGDYVDICELHQKFLDYVINVGIIHRDNLPRSNPHATTP